MMHRTHVGFVENHKVRDVLIKGQIFLNCSLTEVLTARACALLLRTDHSTGAGVLHRDP